RVAGLWGVRARALLALGGGHGDLRLARVLAGGLWGLSVRVLVAGLWGLPVRVLVAGWSLLGGVRRRDRLLPGRDLRGGSVRLRSR
ncbi:MAG: hypothetical protein Q4G45_09415, partial [Actinomycetia bacterium]|nr:hypothetical protein [Actinomycetes bacterium]